MRASLKPILLNSVPGWVRNSYGLLLPSFAVHFDEGRGWAQGAGTANPSSFVTTSRAQSVSSYGQTVSGSLSSFLANTSRITDLGDTIEAARTNLCLQSQTLDSATWGFNIFITVGANSATAPDGTLTADGLIPAAGSHSVALGQANLSVVSGSAYTYSAHFKYNAALGLPWVELTTTGDATRRAWFNSQTGAVGTLSGFTSATTTALANGFFRFAGTLTAASSTSAETIYSSSRPSDNSVGNVTGDGVTPAYYEWGAQFELGSAASSYIPTTTVPVTRAADSAVVNLGNVTRIVYEFSDGSTQTITGVTPYSSYAIPTNLSQPVIARMTGYPA